MSLSSQSQIQTIKHHVSTVCKRNHGYMICHLSLCCFEFLFFALLLFFVYTKSNKIQSKIQTIREKIKTELTKQKLKTLKNKITKILAPNNSTHTQSLQFNIIQKNIPEQIHTQKKALHYKIMLMYACICI